jgi:uncharacterized protein DUF7003
MSERSAEEWRDDVLRQLDEAQDEYALLGPGNAHYPSAELRMDSFASDGAWLLAVQLLAWGKRDGGFVRLVQFFGNAVDDPGEPTIAEPIASGTGSPLFKDGKCQLDPNSYSVKIRGSERHFTFSPEDYRREGIEPDKMAPELAILRMLAVQAGDELMLSPQEVLSQADQPELNHLFRLTEWHHPDPGEDEVPSELPCWRHIAEAIAEKAARDLPDCPDINTHWSRWTDYE